VHFNGKTWQRLSVPGKLFAGRVTGDGRGGLWLTADNVGTTQGYLLHRSAAGA
jgi:hypothetical protein